MKIFRKIRYDLIENNPAGSGAGKTGKYLKYAIVIGILIALQINNWNVFRQNEDLEIEYLKGIKTNLIDDISELERHFETDTTNFVAYTFLIRAFNSDSIESKHQEIISNFYSSLTLHWFEGQDVVFEDMKSSGKLNLIQSDTIKYSIQKYYKFFEEVIKQENQNISEIVRISDRNIQYFNISSFIEPRYEEQWNGNTGPPSLSFTEVADFNLIKPKLIDNLSRIKFYKYLSHKARFEFYQKAISLNMLIEQYLDEKK